MALAFVSLRKRSRFAAALLVGFESVCVWVFPSGCSSPAPDSGAGGDPDRAARRSANPFLGDDPGALRDSIAAAYFAERGLSFAVAPSVAWNPLDERAELRLVARNDGALPVTFVARRERGIWPFDAVERACVCLEVSGRYASLRTGAQQVRASLNHDGFEDWTIAPGEQSELLVPVALELAADADAAVVEVAARLHPLAIRCGDEPERVVTLRFPAVELRYVPAAVAAATPGDPAPFTRALEQVANHLLGAALRQAEAQGVVAVVDALMLSLPGPDLPGRRARLVALEWLTGRRHGDSVERWRSWWESADGMSFSAGESKRP